MPAKLNLARSGSAPGQAGLGLSARLNFQQSRAAVAIQTLKIEHEHLERAFMRIWRTGGAIVLGIGGLLAGFAALRAAEKSPEPTLKSGIDRANFDESVKPGDDFF